MLALSESNMRLPQRSLIVDKKEEKKRFKE